MVTTGRAHQRGYDFQRQGGMRLTECAELKGGHVLAMFIASVLRRGHRRECHVLAWQADQPLFRGSRWQNSYVASQSFDAERKSAQQALGWVLDAGLCAGAGLRLRFADGAMAGRSRVDRAMRSSSGGRRRRAEDMLPGFCCPQS